MEQLNIRDLRRYTAVGVFKRLRIFCQAQPDNAVYQYDNTNGPERITINAHNGPFVLGCVHGTDPHLTIIEPDCAPRRLYLEELGLYLPPSHPYRIGTDDYAFQRMSFRYIRDVSDDTGSYLCPEYHWYSKVELVGGGEHIIRLTFIIYPSRLGGWLLHVMNASGDRCAGGACTSVAEAINLSSTILNSVYRDFVKRRLAYGDINYASLCPAFFQAYPRLPIHHR